MIRLNMTSEPVWLDLTGGVEVLAAPLTTAVRAAVRSQLDAAVPEPDRWDPDTLNLLRLHVLARLYARVTILDWRGVADEAGEPLHVTPERIDALMQGHAPQAQAWMDLHVVPALLRDQEKKGLSPLPNGASAAEPNTAGPATASAPTAPAA